MVKLKMVAGKTYSCGPALGSSVTVNRGDVITVEDKWAEFLLNDNFQDALNNTHHYFVEVDGDVGSDDDDSEDGETPKKPTRSRKPSAKVSKE